MAEGQVVLGIQGTGVEPGLGVGGDAGVTAESDGALAVDGGVSVPDEGMAWLWLVGGSALCLLAQPTRQVMRLSTKKSFLKRTRTIYRHSITTEPCSEEVSKEPTM